MKNLFAPIKYLAIMTLICGLIYTGVITLAAQLIFPGTSNGSIIEVDGKKYGSELMAQQFTDDSHMWGRAMNLDISTYTNANGERLMYAAPTNQSPASEDYSKVVAERLEKIKTANPSMEGVPVPVDLVTGSGSGLDPHISQAAAQYQVARLAIANDMSEMEIKKIVEECTQGKLLGIFGEKTVNVLKVNLKLEGILA